MSESCLPTPAGEWKIRRRTFVKGAFLFLIALLLYVGFLLNYHWVVIGYCKGQPCYKGLPADYWKARIQRFENWRTDPNNVFTTDRFGPLLSWLGMKPDLEGPLAAKDKDELPVLLDLVKDKDTSVRMYALQLIASIQPATEEIIDALIQALDDPDGAVRGEALEGLAVSRETARKAVPRVMKEMKKSTMALRALRAIDPIEGRKKLIENLENLCKLHPNDPNHIERSSFILSNGAWQDSQVPLTDWDWQQISSLLNLLMDDDPGLRSYAARYLGCFQPAPDEVIEHLILSLDDPEFTVRDESYLSLAMAGSAARKAVPRIIRDVNVSSAAFVALAFIDPLTAEKIESDRVMERQLR